MAAGSIGALHTAARRYCVDHIARWHRVYAALRAQRPASRTYSYTDDDYRTFPRYHVLGAILSAIERWLPAEVATLDEARARLITAARTASNRFTDPPEPPLAAAAMAEEREAFERFARESTEADWATAEPLPFRRVLAKDEADELYRWFCGRWGTWYAGGPDRDDVPPALTLRDDVWDALPLLRELRALLARRGVDHLLEIREIHDSFELALAAAHFVYDGAEGYWFVRDGDWMIYASHESSITLGGAWLIDAVRAALPTIDTFTYRR